MIEKKSLADLLRQTTYLPDRTPAMVLDGSADAAFARVADYRDGVISVGHYSGDTEWERHAAGDEAVVVLEGCTTVVLLDHGRCQRVPLVAGDLVVVPQGWWHRFEGSSRLKVLGFTPQPTEHSVELPETGRAEPHDSCGTERLLVFDFARRS